MWFLFGVITLISVCCYQAHKRLNAAWRGDEATTANIKYQYDFETHKGKVKGLLLGISAPETLDFTLKREKSLDRFFKKVGIAKEHQTGNAKFDDLVYVVSDHDALQEHISHSEDVTKAAVKIFSYTYAYSSDVDEIRCNSGRIWLHIKIRDDLKKQRPDQIAKKLVPKLKTISDSLREASIQQCQTYKDPFVFKAAIILAISSALFINGWVQMFRMAYQEIPYTLDRSDLYFGTGFLSFMLIASLIVGAFYLLGRSARTHLVLIELLLTGTLGAVLTVGSQLRDINMELDSANAEKYYVGVTDKKSSRSRRSTSYYIYVENWLDDEYNTRRIEVSSSLYGDVSKGDEVMIKQKPGALNFRWVESVFKL